MKRRTRESGFNTLLYRLDDEGVDFRNRLRGWIGAAVWLVLSSLHAIFMLAASGASGLIGILFIVGMSFVKYIPLLNVTYSLARKMAARYIDDVYELNNEDLASDFLEEVTFGYGHEKITINEGRVLEKDERSPLILIGGPGMIQVNLDSAALLEKVNGEPEVIYPRSAPWKLGRFERIREIGRYDEVGKREYAIINLRDQFVKGLSVKARTKDGIPLEAHDIKVIFSVLRRRGEREKVQGDAYLFDERAVEALVYGQTIVTPQPKAPSGVSFPWDTTAVPLVLSELEEFIKSHNLSEILASISQKELDAAFKNDQTVAQIRLEITGQQVKVGPRREAPKFQPRSAITAHFFEKEFREKAAEMGVSIEWIDIGTWQLPSNLILEKHKKAWELSRQNAAKRSALERSKKRREMEELLKLVDNVVIHNFDKKIEFRRMSEEELKKIDPVRKTVQYESLYTSPNSLTISEVVHTTLDDIVAREFSPIESPEKTKLYSYRFAGER